MYFFNMADSLQIKLVLGPFVRFMAKFHKIVHHRLTEEEFKEDWAMLIGKYGLEKHRTWSTR